jgi:hypothetical protein
MREREGDQEDSSSMLCSVPIFPFFFSFRLPTGQQVTLLERFSPRGGMPVTRASA